MGQDLEERALLYVVCITGRRYGVTGAASGIYGTFLFRIHAGQYIPDRDQVLHKPSGHAEKPHGIS